MARGVIRGNVLRAAERIFEFSEIETPPVHWAIGEEAVAGARAKAKSIVDELDAFESWAEGLTD